MGTIVTVTGIRPDFIRMSKVIEKFDKNFDHILVHSGQHYQNTLSDVFFKDLLIRKPDFNLEIGGEGKEHFHQVSELSVKLIELLRKLNKKVDYVVYLGDSNSVLSALSLAKEGYKIAHIEAGMRSWDMRMLEEINRRACDMVSTAHFCYHYNYKKNLVLEGVNPGNIFTVGNTIVEPLKEILASRSFNTDIKHICLDIHRPENFKDSTRLATILRYAIELGEHYKLPVKLLEFPRTIQAIKAAGINISKLQTVPLMGYIEFIQFQLNSMFIISDSGTAQEEPAIMDIPVLVPREYTERPESYLNGNSLKLDINKNISDHVNWINNYPKSYRNSEWLTMGKFKTSDLITAHLKNII